MKIREGHLLRVISTENVMRPAMVYLELMDCGVTRPTSAVAQVLISVASVSTIYSSALPQFYPAALNHNLQDPRSVSSYFESPSGSILIHTYSSAQSKGIVLHFSFPRLHCHVKFRKPFHELTSISMDMQSNSCQMKQRLGA